MQPKGLPKRSAVECAVLSALLRAVPVPVNQLTDHSQKFAYYPIAMLVVFIAEFDWGQR